MKITSVDIIKMFKVPSEQCEIGVAGPWHPIIVRINTDEAVIIGLKTLRLKKC